MFYGERSNRGALVHEIINHNVGHCRKNSRTALVALLVMVFLTGCAKSTAAQLKEQLELGQNYLLEMNYEEAVVAFSKAIELDPKSLEAYEGLANVYIAQGQYDEAYAVLGQAEENIAEENLIEKLWAEIPKRIAEALLSGQAGNEDWQTVYDSIVTDANEEHLLRLTEPVIVEGENGQGIGIYPDSGITCLYVGGYEDGKRSGYGIMGYDDESREQGLYKYFYEGEWVNDYPNGEGTIEMYTALDREVHEVIHGTFADGWENGEIIRKQSDNNYGTHTFIYNAKNGYPEMAGIDESVRDSGSEYFYIIAESLESEYKWLSSIPNPRYGFWLACRNEKDR